MTEPIPLPSAISIAASSKVCALFVSGSASSPERNHALPGDPRNADQNMPKPSVTKTCRLARSVGCSGNLGAFAIGSFMISMSQAICSLARHSYLTEVVPVEACKIAIEQELANIAIVFSYQCNDLKIHINDAVRKSF